MLETPDQVAAAVRADAPRIALGLSVVILSLAAIVFQAVGKRRKDLALLWFALFSMLFGIRLLIETGLVVLAVGLSKPAQAYLIASISYVLPSFASLFMYAVFPRWRRLFRWFVGVQIAFAVSGLICDLLLQRPFYLKPFNNLLVIIFFLGVYVLLARVEQNFETKVLRVGFLFFSVTVICNNVGELLQRNFNFEPLGFAVYLACLATIAIRRDVHFKDRLTALEEELAIARRIQTSILPSDLPQSPSLTIAARYLPMTAVAGDFYDFLMIDDKRLGILIADVSGHGVPAALIASMIKIAGAAQLRLADAPALVLRGINQTLCPSLQSQFLTAAYLFFDLEAQVFRYSAAAHPRMQWLHCETLTVEAIEENGLPIGVTPTASYAFVERSFSPGDRFVLFTDGLLEASNQHNEFFGEERLRQALLDSAALDASQSADFLLHELSRWAGHSRGRLQEDDFTLLVVDIAHV